MSLRPTSIERRFSKSRLENEVLVGGGRLSKECFEPERCVRECFVPEVLVCGGGDFLVVCRNCFVFWALRCSTFSLDKMTSKWSFFKEPAKACYCGGFKASMVEFCERKLNVFLHPHTSDFAGRKIFQEKLLKNFQTRKSIQGR